MTILQTTCEKIALLPSENVQTLLAIVDEMLKHNGESAVSADKGKSKEVKQKAFQTILKLREQSSFPQNFDYNEALDEALKKKYECFS